MGILNKIGEAASSASRNVNEKTKNMSDTSNLGKTYYKTPDKVDELKAYCDDIETRKKRIKKMRFELQTMKGFKICPNCQAEVQEKFQFCGVCGAKLPSGDEDFD